MKRIRNHYKGKTYQYEYDYRQVTVTWHEPEFAPIEANATAKGLTVGNYIKAAVEAFGKSEKRTARRKKTQGE